MAERKDRRDPSLSVMTMDILGQILSRSDKPKELGNYLAEEIRELTGARCVLIIRSPDSFEGAGREILTIHPERRRSWVESPQILAFFQSHVSDTSPCIWNATGSLKSDILEREGFSISFSVPIRTGDIHVGSLFALGLPDIIHIESVVSLLSTLSTIVALVLRNASLFEYQDLIIAERTAEVQAAYEEIRNELEERKKIEEALRSTNEYLENLISHSNEPILIWDKDLNITRINYAAEQLLGKIATDVVGKSLNHLFPPDQVHDSRHLVETATWEGARWETVRIDILHTDGSVRNVIWNSATIYSPDGHEPVATIAQGRDVTAELQLEREKVAALSQIQKNLAQLAILNDEIRNPLSIILAYAELADNTHIADPIIHEVRKIDDCITNLDKRWIESEKVLNAIRKHYHLYVSPSGPDGE